MFLGLNAKNNLFYLQMKGGAMKKSVKILYCLFAVVVTLLFIIPVTRAKAGVATCAQGSQLDEVDKPTGSTYEIYMPPPGVEYNGRFIIWAHGFQDANEDVGIPYDQLCFDDVCIPDILIELGFGFATNSYSKTGLAVKEGKEDILDLVEKLTEYGATCGDIEEPQKIYLIGASEGGLITALLAEQNPDVFDAGCAFCGPVGDFPLQINYLGDARVTFEYFFPNKIPGYGIFNGIYYSDDDGYPVPPNWEEYFNGKILPLFKRHPLKAKQWFKVAKLPYDPANYLTTVVNSAKDVLRYSVINLLDANKVLGGQPFDNRWKWYTGSDNDFRLNLRVKRFTPDISAIIEMKTHYNTSGALDIPLITMHTLRDQQVPYWHEMLYNLKTLAAGSFLKEHFNIPINRYGHCNFTLEEALGGFTLMLFYAGDLEMLSALERFVQAQQSEF
jgi:pimeloyl-ACP methyl ester carboxylesterase